MTDFNRRHAAGEKDFVEPDANPIPADDENLAARMGGTWGKHIEDASTNAKVADSKPQVVQGGKPQQATAVPSTTADDEPDDKDKKPPATSKEDHFKDFPGLGRTRSPGLGM